MVRISESNNAVGAANSQENIFDPTDKATAALWLGIGAMQQSIEFSYHQQGGRLRHEFNLAFGHPKLKPFDGVAASSEVRDIRWFMGRYYRNYWTPLLPLELPSGNVVQARMRSYEDFVSSRTRLRVETPTDNGIYVRGRIDRISVFDKPFKTTVLGPYDTNKNDTYNFERSYPLDANRIVAQDSEEARLTISSIEKLSSQLSR